METAPNDSAAGSSEPHATDDLPTLRLKVDEWLEKVRQQVESRRKPVQSSSVIATLEEKRAVDELTDVEVRRYLTKTEIAGWSAPREYLRYGLWRRRIEDLEDHLETCAADVMVILEVQLKARRNSNEKAPLTTHELLQYDDWVCQALKKKGVRNPYISEELIPNQCVLTRETPALQHCIQALDAINSNVGNSPTRLLTQSIIAAVCPERGSFKKLPNNDKYALWRTLRWLICNDGMDSDPTAEQVRNMYRLAQLQIQKDADNAELAILSAKANPSEEDLARIDKLNWPRALNFHYLSLRTMKAFTAIAQISEQAPAIAEAIDEEPDFPWLTYLDDELWDNGTDDETGSAETRLYNRCQNERMLQPNCERSGFSVKAAEGGVGRGAEIFSVLETYTKEKNCGAKWYQGPDTSQLPDESVKRDGETIFVRCANGWELEKIECKPLMTDERPAFVIRVRKRFGHYKNLVLIAGHAPAPARAKNSEKWFESLGTLAEGRKSNNVVVLGDFNTGKALCESQIQFVKDFYGRFSPDLEDHIKIITSVKKKGEGGQMYSEPYDKVLVLKNGKLDVVQPMSLPNRWSKALQIRRYSDHCFVTSVVRLT